MSLINLNFTMTYSIFNLTIALFSVCQSFSLSLIFPFHGFNLTAIAYRSGKAWATRITHPNSWWLQIKVFLTHSTWSLWVGLFSHSETQTDPRSISTPASIRETEERAYAKHPFGLKAAICKCHRAPPPPFH